MLIALLLIPFIAALSSWFIPADLPRRIVLVGVAAVELLLALSTWVYTPAPFAGEILMLDSMGRLVLTLTCILFFAASIYGVGYLKAEERGKRTDFVQGLHFSNAPEATFTACLLLFLSVAVLVATTCHFGVLWIGIESTTLVSAPLIYFHRHQRSLEATWKYLLICSVGIALALVGNLLLDISMQSDAGHGTRMTLSTLVAAAPGVHPAWFKAAFVFLLIGYGTKMGAAPMHTWLPDAHSEAPSMVSALLSGALLNCAFLGIYRVTQISAAAQMTDFSSPLLMAFGFFSLITAALFIVGLGDFKRMLAYSSVEHMGILLLALGVGFEAARGGVLHMASHSMIKAALFLLAGNILAKYHTKSSHDVTGLRRTMPVTALLWMTGILAICGMPPFSLFMSELSVLQGLLHYGLIPAMAYLFLLGVVFIGMVTPALRMCGGRPPHGIAPSVWESSFLTLPPALLLALVLVLGLYMPDWVNKVLQDAAAAAIGQ